MDWYDVSSNPHRRTLAYGGRLDALSNDWERELAALWRLEADVNNGAYLQFLGNWGRDSYVYAAHALHRIRAVTMASIVEQCQALVDAHCSDRTLTYSQLLERLPQKVADQVLALSYRFMDYPDDLPSLAMGYYANRIAQLPPVADDVPEFDIVNAVWKLMPAEEKAKVAKRDAQLTDHKCPHCGQPCPSYRKTCKHCLRSVRNT
jgi:hypothetical protein